MHYSVAKATEQLSRLCNDNLKKNALQSVKTFTLLGAIDHMTKDDFKESNQIFDNPFFEYLGLGMVTVVDHVNNCIKTIMTTQKIRNFQHGTVCILFIPVSVGRQLYKTIL